jgi:hypothetical protein
LKDSKCFEERHSGTMAQRINGSERSRIRITPGETGGKFMHLNSDLLTIFILILA